MLGIVVGTEESNRGLVVKDGQGKEYRNVDWAVSEWEPEVGDLVWFQWEQYQEGDPDGSWIVWEMLRVSEGERTHRPFAQVGDEVECPF